MRTSRLPAWILGGLIALTATVASADEISYTVQAGDILGRIAEEHGVSVSDLRRWNDIDGDDIYVGQELTIDTSRRSSSSSSSQWIEYEVVSGDTLGRIAARHEVSIDDIVGWNRGLNPDRISIGQEIRIRRAGRGTRRVEYEVQRGDFLGRIARDNNVTIDQIVSWNRGLDPDRLQIGQTLVFMIEGPEVPSESVGRANDGSLVNGEMLPDHRLYDIRDDDRSWGTNETISSIIDAFDYLGREFDEMPVLPIHDLSYEEGGRMRGHRSHQSGRDADIGYYHDGCRRSCSYEDIDDDDIDAERTWALLHYWLDNELVEYVFIDYSLQEPLYEYAEEHGASDRELSEWFQYPRGRRTARGIIRHEPNHDDHMHVRFGCPRDDGDCR